MQAAYAAEHLVKAQAVAFSGRLEPREWTDLEGNQRVALEVLCEAAHATMRSPDPLRAFGQRIRARRGSRIATVAVARKLAFLTWQLLATQQDCLYERL